ncbi:MAG: hypothetical protein Q8N28_01585 [bacterium]|nr:hypothetical protein [bacterium]
MFEKEKFKNPQEIKDPEETIETKKKVEFAPESDHSTGVVRAKKEFEEERRKKLNDPSRWRDLK